jgi:hypothetical protein
MALKYCHGNVRAQELYLFLDKVRNPQSDHEYSRWKLQEARADLRTAKARVEAFNKPHLKLVGER